MKEFYSIITNSGIESIINAKITGEEVELLYLAVGDSDGAYYTPSSQQKKLANEKHRTKINMIYRDPDYPTQMIIEAAVDEIIGGFFIREVGIFDANDELFAIGRYPVTYKPVNESGSCKDLYIRMVLRFSETPNIKLFLNPHSALVSADQLENFANKDFGNVDDELKSHQNWLNLQGGNQNERYHLTENENLTVGQLLDLKNSENIKKCIVVNEDGNGFSLQDLPSGIPIFTVFHRLTSETPPGAYPLWTGEWIRNCKNLFSYFWNEILRLQSLDKIRIITDDVYENEILNFGETGGFVINESSGDLRLPQITRAISCIEALNQIGQPINDQLQGHWHNVNLRQDTYNSATPYDHLYGNDGITVGQADTTSADERIWPIAVNRSPGGAFDIMTNPSFGSARIGNETRGKSVQLAQFIQVYNAATSISLAETNQLINLLQGKADVSLSNVPGAFYVVAEQRGKNGFIKYSDGRCEQWGLALHVGASWVTVPYHFDFADDEINLVLCAVTPANNSSGNPNPQLRYDYNRSRFVWHIPGGNSIWHCNWHAWGTWK